MTALMQRKKYRWHAQYSLDRADGIDQTNAPVTDELENLFLSIEDRRAPLCSSATPFISPASPTVDAV